MGTTLPIGAYLFNPAAANTSVNGQTFTEWFIDDYLFGPNGGANPNISGFFFDDQFNPTGATESLGNLANLGLSPQQGAQLSEDYWAYMNVVYAEVLKRGKFAWQQLWTGQQQCDYYNSYSCLGSTGTHLLVQPKSCASDLRTLCAKGSPPQTRAMMFPFAGSDPSELPQFQQDLANFLLVRGPHAFLGHAWKGCSKDYLYPDALNADYGEPLGLCTETAPNSGVFTREWTKASVKMDCSTYTGTITMK